MGPWRWFTVKEALWLPSWKRQATESELRPAIRAELDRLFTIMDLVRDLVNRPVKIHCAFRPPAYNKLVGGAKASCHLTGRACDFSVPGLTCDQVRTKLLPYLEYLGVRMENLPGSNWVHIDTRPPGPGGRYFTP